MSAKFVGVILLENLEASLIFELMFICDEFRLEELVKHLENYLIQTKANWLRLKFAHVYRKVFHNDNFQELQKWSIEIATKYPEKSFDNENFTSLQKDALIPLIKSDDLQMQEVNIWNYIIHWGIAQNPDLPSDIDDWSNKNFMTLKTTLQECLPYIRYFQMSSDDIVENVQPYQQILEKNLWKDISRKFMGSNRQQITSTILPPRKILQKSPLPPRVPPKYRKPEPPQLKEPFSMIINESHAVKLLHGLISKLRHIL
ncbi:hypothetical protein C2G38_2138053 [Gigaspora rosea]|uniref:BACK domain-containing protein n=1 Tax=Gigaspora rosea TaxID=44941 RepID=A0A397VWI6_9GLOM|nr:hypothetical protein C2G38_2138053 [Gigaspora rosea]